MQSKSTGRQSAVVLIALRTMWAARAIPMKCLPSDRLNFALTLVLLGIFFPPKLQFVSSSAYLNTFLK